MTICCAWLNSLWIWVEVFINIFGAVRAMWAEGWPKTVWKKRTSSWWPEASLWCVIDCVNIVLICKFTFSRQLNQSTKLIIFFFFLKIGSFETKNQLQKFVIILFCFWFHDNLISTLFLKPWLVFSDWANMTSFSEFISKGTHSSHPMHTRKTALWFQRIFIPKKQKEEHMFQLEHQRNTISLLLEQSNFHKHTNKQLFSFLFCFFVCLVWQMLNRMASVVLFFVFLGFESSMTNKRLMSVSVSLFLTTNHLFGGLLHFSQFVPWVDLCPFWPEKSHTHFASQSSDILLCCASQQSCNNDKSEYFEDEAGLFWSKFLWENSLQSAH